MELRHSLDPICNQYGVRMIVVDRPGIGATPTVPLETRVQTSCRMSILLTSQGSVALRLNSASDDHLGAPAPRRQASSHPRCFSRRLASPPFHPWGMC